MHFRFFRASMIACLLAPLASAEVAGSHDKNEVVVQQTETCPFSVWPQTLQTGVVGGPATVTLTSSPACSWTAVTGAAWITVVSAAAGSGSGNVQLTIAPNPGSGQRTGSVVVGGLPVWITQAGKCDDYSLSPSSLSTGAGEGNGSFEVTAGSGCSWTATSNAPWIAMGAGSGTGGGTVSFLIAPNPTGASRTGTVVVAGHTFTVVQDARCRYILSVQQQIATPLGGKYSAALTTDPGCSWTASSNRNWIQVYPLSGTGPATLSYSVFPNYSDLIRQGAVVAGGHALGVTQGLILMPPDERFIGNLYFAAMGRLPGPGEVAGHIASGRTRAELVNVFMNVPEFLNAAKFVAGLYVGLLGRDAEFGGWMFQRNAMSQSGAWPHGLAENFLNSAEFRLKNPNLNDAGFIRLLYRQVLGREATAGEIAFQVSHIRARSYPEIALVFLTSEEFKLRVGPRLTGFLLYALILQRDPTTAELDWRGSQLASGTPVTTVAAELIGP